MENRIPAYDALHPEGMLQWFAELSARGLLFHPEEDPSDIIRIADGERVFDDNECVALRNTLADMQQSHGQAMIEACYPIFMRAGGQRLDA